jgi:hypothetical protein
MELGTGEFMTAEEVHSSIKEIFADPRSGAAAEMKFDFRKIRASYVCVADGREFLCTRFESTASGLCKFKDDVFCLSF